MFFSRFRHSGLILNIISRVHELCDKLMGKQNNESLTFRSSFICQFYVSHLI